MQHHYKKRARTRSTLADVLERLCRVRTLARFAASRPCGKSCKPIIMHSHKHSRLPRIQWKDLLVVEHLCWGLQYPQTLNPKPFGCLYPQNWDMSIREARKIHQTWTWTLRVYACLGFRVFGFRVSGFRGSMGCLSLGSLAAYSLYGHGYKMSVGAPDNPRYNPYIVGERCTAARVLSCSFRTFSRFPCSNSE